MAILNCFYDLHEKHEIKLTCNLLWYEPSLESALIKNKKVPGEFYRNEYVGLYSLVLTFTRFY